MLLSRRQLDALLAQAASASQEVCGVLIGRRVPEPVLERIVAGRNVHPRPEQHFLLDAATLLQADVEAHAAGLELIGFYHSHPNGRTLPSATDRRDAWHNTIMLIIGAEAGRRPSISAWVVTGDGSARPESIRPRPEHGTRPEQREQR